MTPSGRKSVRRIRAMLLVLTIAFPLVARADVADEAEVRKWKTGTKGTLIVEGRLVSVDKGFARVNLSKGKFTLIPVDRLFPEDREYVEEWLKKPGRRNEKEREKPATKKQAEPDEIPTIPDSDRERLELVRSTRLWQKSKLNVKDVAKLITQLRSPDREQRKIAMTTLAMVHPNEKNAEEVVQTAKQLMKSDEQEFFKQMYVEICSTWECYPPAMQISRRARNLEGLERLVVNGKGFDQPHAIYALMFLMSEEAAAVVVRNFDVSQISCNSALIEMGPIAAPAVLPMLDSKDATLRRKGLEIMEEIGGADHLDKIKKMLLDPDPQVRLAASGARKKIEQRNR